MSKQIELTLTKETNLAIPQGRIEPGTLYPEVNRSWSVP
jgi:hypothetical protein